MQSKVYFAALSATELSVFIVAYVRLCVSVILLILWCSLYTALPPFRSPPSQFAPSV